MVPDGIVTTHQNVVSVSDDVLVRMPFGVWTTALVLTRVLEQDVLARYSHSSSIIGTHGVD
uniref:Uncharacterized protein n=1 Tax=Hyaloperonospora arabidopsidis (strain Emoy2) TaxID=559515 RepID=M4BA60_HYAAE